MADELTKNNMAEALTIVSLFSEGIVIGKHIAGLIKAMKSVPDELMDLQNEVNEFRLILHEIEQTGLADQNDVGFQKLCFKAAEQLNNLEDMTEKYSPTSRQSCMKFITEKGKMQKMLADMQET